MISVNRIPSNSQRSEIDFLEYCKNHKNIDVTELCFETGYNDIEHKHHKIKTIDNLNHRLIREHNHATKNDMEQLDDCLKADYFNVCMYSIHN